MIELGLLGAAFVTLLASGAPVAFAIGAASALVILVSGQPLVAVSHYMFSGVNSFILVAVPMFVLAGDVMSRAGMTRSLTDLADLFVGRLRGGLGHTNILASVFFSGITGSSTADTTAIGSVLIPAMHEKGYDRGYATALTVASSIIGAIIPPSLTFVIYALAVGDVSIGGLFAAGLLPGLVTAGALMLLNIYVTRRRGYRKRDYAYSVSERLTILRKGAVVLVMPVIIAFGVLSGTYTATEAAAVAAAYAIVMGFATRQLAIKSLAYALFDSAKTSSIMLLLLAVSSLLSYVLATQGVPELVSAAFRGLSDSSTVFLLVVNLTLLLIGTVLDLFPAILIIGPILAPISELYGVDPLHFGVLFCVNLLVGLNTPPVGSGLFIGAAIGGVSFEKLVVEILPFLLMQIVVLLLITYIPVITLFLPHALGFS